MATMRQWAAWTERQIKAVALAEKLHVGFAGLVQGPTVVTVRLRLLRPNRREMGVLQSKAFAQAVAQALHTDGVRIVPSGRGVLIEIPSPQPRTPSSEELARFTRGLTACVGLDARRKPVMISLEQAPHWLAIGPSGRGKTEALKSSLYGLLKANPPRKVVALILARKRASWREFERAAGCLGVVSKSSDLEDALAWLDRVLEQRTEEGVRWPAIVIIADDLINLAADVDRGALERIASMGREPRMFLWISTQTDGRAGGLTQPLAANMRLRLVFGGASAGDAARFAGAGGLAAHQVGRTPGDCALVRDGVSQRVATAMSSPTAIAMLPQGNHLDFPWKSAAGIGRNGSGGGSANGSWNHFRTAQEPPETGLEPGGTVQNRLEPPGTGREEGGHADGRVGRASPLPRPSSEPVLTGSAARERELSTWEQKLLQRLTARDHELIRAVYERFPLDPNREPTSEEKALIRAVHERMESVSATTRICYGFKNGKTFGWVKLALAQSETQPTTSTPPQTTILLGEADLPDEIDLASEEGRQLFQAL